MRVLIVHPHLASPVGSARVVKNLSKCLGQRGIDSSVLTLTPCGETEGPDCKGSDLYFPASFGYERRPGSNGVGEAMRLIKEIKSLGAMLKRKAEDFDVVNLYNFPSTWAAYGLKKPVVWMFNEPGDIRENLRKSLLMRSVYGLGVRMDRHIINNYVDTICVGDESNRERVMQRYGREPRLIPYGMDIAAHCPPGRDEAKRKYGLQGRFVVLHPGILSPHKNQMESVRAVGILRKKIKDIVLVITGLSRGSYKDSLDAYIRSNRLEGHVIFTGHVKESETQKLYRASDVAVFPEKSEGGWLYPFEVISSGATLVVSKAFAAGGLIGRERLGLVTDDMASAIEYVFLNPSKSRLAAEKAFSWMSRNFGWDNFAGKMVDVFDSVIT